MKRNNLLYILFLAIFGIVGGYFTALYTIEMMDSSALEEIIAQVGSIDAVIIITVLQSFIYSLALGLIGRAISVRIGLWREFTFEAKPMAITVIASLVGGVIFILADALLFARLIPPVMESYLVKPTFNYVIASVTYGGVVEEVMLRLFLMSLIAFIISRFSKDKMANDTHLIVANIIATLIFAAGHLPATAMSLGLTPIIVIRCFLMNGAFGLIFGRMYRKHGIGYAMLTHAGVHIVSKIIWILFI